MSKVLLRTACTRKLSSKASGLPFRRCVHLDGVSLRETKADAWGILHGLDQYGLAFAIASIS